MTLHIANAIVVVTLILKSAGSLHSGHFTPAQEEILPEFHENELFTQQDLHYMEPTDDAFMRSTLGTLQNGILQGAETDAIVSTPELYIHLRQIVNTLGLLGNSFMKREDPVSALASLEVACPLMEAIPLVHLRKSINDISNCYDLLKGAYLESLTSRGSGHYEEYLTQIKRSFVHLQFEFNYKAILSNASAEPVVLQDFLRQYIATYMDPTTHLADFLARDVIRVEDDDAYDEHLDMLYRVVWERTMAESPPLLLQRTELPTEMSPPRHIHVPRETADSSWTRPLESPPPPASSFTAGDAGTLLKTDHEEVPVKKQKHLLPGRASSDVVGSTDQAPVTDTRPEPVPQQRGALPIAPADFILWQWTTVQPPQPCPSRGSEVHPPANKLHLPGGALHHIEPSSTVLDTPIASAQSQAPRTAVSTVQANSSATFALMTFLALLSVGVGAIVYADHTQQASRRKPKRSPRRSLRQQTEDIAEAIQRSTMKLLQAVAYLVSSGRRAVRSVMSKRVAHATMGHIVMMWQIVYADLRTRVARLSTEMWRYCVGAQHVTQSAKGAASGGSVSGRRVEGVGGSSLNVPGGRKKPVISSRQPNDGTEALCASAGAVLQEEPQSQAYSLFRNGNSYRCGSEIDSTTDSLKEIPSANHSMHRQRPIRVAVLPKLGAGGVLAYLNDLELHRREFLNGEQYERRPGDTGCRHVVSYVEESATGAIPATALASTPTSDSRSPTVSVKHALPSRSTSYKHEDTSPVSQPRTHGNESSNSVSRYPVDEQLSARGGGEHLLYQSSDATMSDASSDTDTDTDTERSSFGSTGGIGFHDDGLRKSDNVLARPEGSGSVLHVSGSSSVYKRHSDSPLLGEGTSKYQYQSMCDSLCGDPTATGITICGIDGGDQGDFDSDSDPIATAAAAVVSGGAGGGLVGVGSGILSNSFWSSARSDSSGGEEEVDDNGDCDLSLMGVYSRVLTSPGDVAPPPGFSAAAKEEASHMSLLHGLDNSLFFDSLLSTGELSPCLSLPTTGHISTDTDIDILGPDSLGLSSAASSSPWDAIYPRHRPSGPFPRSNYSGYRDGTAATSLLPMEAPLLASNVTVSFTVRCLFLPPSRVATMKIASALFGEWHTSKALSMRCSLANPELWGLTVEVPMGIPHFAFKYIAIDSAGVMWIEPGSPRLIPLATDLQYGGKHVEREDTFEHALHSARDTFLYTV